jgi:VIT1/CCC1 family predicted Fe2+/Mn2+ transporter
MSDTGDRMTRAGDYVLGLMDERERERAERDLEVDPAFRDAVVEIAGRMRVFDRAPDTAPEDGWKQLKERIAGLPQMRAAAAPARPEPPAVPEAPVTFGRRRSDARRETIVPAAAPKVTRVALHSVPGRLALAIAVGLIAAFALGYVAGVSSIAPPSPAAATGP